MSNSLLSDIFNDPAGWQVIASGLAEGNVTAATGPDGRPALRLDYDFQGGGGFVVARKEIQFALPKTFEILFQLRGDGPPNNFEFKIADPAGTNAWRHLRQNFKLPHGWKECRINERDLPFAWGPAGGGAPSFVGAIEVVIAAGPGGAGTVCFSDFSLNDQTLYFPKKITASSSLPNQPAAAVFEASSPSGWQADEGDEAPRWAVDFGRLVRFGGLLLDWPPQMPPRQFEIQISKNGRTWTTIHQANHDRGTRSHIAVPQGEARHLRINFGNRESAALIALRLRPDSFSHTPNEFIHAVAADFPRGWFPRYWHREQSYWTPIGSPDGRRRGLINEEGLVEVDEGLFSLEPFLLAGDRLVTWADAEISTSLAADGLPFPTVTWLAEGLRLTVRPWVDGAADELVLRVTYRVESRLPYEVKLAVAVRPFQVNPPWQAFRNLGGRSQVRRIVAGDDGWIVDGRRIEVDRRPAASGAAAFEEGGVLEYLAASEIPPRTDLDDPSGLGSAAMSWPVPSRDDPFEVTVSVPFFKTFAPLQPDGFEIALARWRDVLSPVEWEVPTIAKEAVRCFRTAAAHILINCDGPAIQPGPRRYTRSWIRDCVIMGSALIKTGRPEVLRNFIQWYQQFQRADGYIPSVVDRDGVDDLVEHDSHGQFLWGVCEVFRVDEDLEWLGSLWPRVSLTAEFLLQLRAQRLTPEFQNSERAACEGLLPESASHEGYLSHPVHSYWDDFWGIRGLEAAAELALAMGRTDDAARWQGEAKSFLTSVLRSIGKVIAAQKLEYIPGSVEWADFDPTATANAIAQLDFADDLPAGPLHAMLDTYLDGFRRKHGGAIPWLNYTAYEIRIIGAFVRLGRRDEAQELLEFFLSDRRPVEWNQWPEITWRDPRSPGHLGDVPHTWIAAEYMLALGSMIANEREGSESMVLAQGLPWSWISEESGFHVKGWLTRFGSLDFRIHARESEVTCEIGTGLRMPAGGLSIAPPLPPGFAILSAADALSDSLEVNESGTSVTVSNIPSSITLILGKTPHSKHS